MTTKYITKKKLSEVLAIEIADKFNVVPIKFDENSEKLVIAVDQDFDIKLIEQLASIVGYELNCVNYDSKEVKRLRYKTYFSQVHTDDVEVNEYYDSKIDFSNNVDTAQLVEAIIKNAVNHKVSDIHFVPLNKVTVLKVRIDGVLIEWGEVEEEVYKRIVNYLKVAANLDIAENRVPQDGKLRITFTKDKLDMRLATMPTSTGECVVIRLLDRVSKHIEIDELGMPKYVLAQLKRFLLRDYGMLVVAGPTGSGKTTTLYAIMQVLNKSDRKLITAEDPIEYELSNCLQIPVNTIGGCDYPSILKSVLRHDPDVIMIGEIRDSASANIAFEAGLTGHFMLTSLHANNSFAAIPRLLDFSVPATIIKDVLDVVIAQRLLTLPCPYCSKNKFKEEDVCVVCHNTGFNGRKGIFEYLALNSSLKGIINDNFNLEKFKDLAIETSKMTTLADYKKEIEYGVLNSSLSL